MSLDCAVCLALLDEPKNAVTIVGGAAVCIDHFDDMAKWPPFSSHMASVASTDPPR